jgi:hypothetical protein
MIAHIAARRAPEVILLILRGRGGLPAPATAAQEVDDWSCTPRPGGVVCSFAGAALCEVAVRTREVRAICP